MEAHHDDPVDTLAERVARAEPLLPELTRERLLLGIHARVAADERRARTRGYGLPAFGLLSAACLLLALWRRPAPQIAVSPPKKLDAKEVPAAASAVAVERSVAPELIPYLVSGGDAARTSTLLDRAQTHLSLAAGERVLAMLADRAHLALIGPAELRVVGADHARVEIELIQGTLLGNYDHARGGALSVRAPEMVSEIVGTVFLVHAARGASRTAVLHGTVRVRTAGERSFTLHDHQALGSGDASVLALQPRDAELLRAHAQSLDPPAEHGLLSITTPKLMAELDGRPLAETPLWLSVAPGLHRVTLRGPGQSVRTFQAQVRAGERSELALTGHAASRRPPRSTQVQVHSAGAPSANDLYRAAESAMRSGDHVQARALLARLLALHPTAPELDLALYELVELALQASDYAAAETALTQLEQLSPRLALRESVAFMRCRLLRARGDGAAFARCFAGFRARFPDSPHK